MHLSRVQFYASSMLDIIEQNRRIEQENNRQDKDLRLAMLANGNYNAEILFPELARDTDEDDIPESTDANDNAIPVKYIFNDAELDPKKVEEEITEMLARAAEGTATFQSQEYTDWI